LSNLTQQDSPASTNKHSGIEPEENRILSGVNLDVRVSKHESLYKAETPDALFLDLLRGDQAHGMRGSNCNRDDMRRSQIFTTVSEEIDLDREWLNFW